MWIFILLLLILFYFMTNCMENYQNTSKECSQRTIDNQIYQYNVNTINVPPRVY